MLFNFPLQLPIIYFFFFSDVNGRCSRSFVAGLRTGGSHSLKIADGQLQTTEFRMVILTDGESNIKRIARQQLFLLEALSHPPSERVESNRAPPIAILSPQFLAPSSRSYIAAAKNSRVGMATWRSENCDCPWTLGLAECVRLNRGSQL